jgi:hypothetical protein
VYLCVFIVLKVHVYVLSRKDWVLSETGVTPPIFPENIPSCIFGKILCTALVCVLVWFSFQTCISHKGLWGNWLSIYCQFSQQMVSKLRLRKNVVLEVWD